MVIHRSLLLSVNDPRLAAYLTAGDECARSRELERILTGEVQPRVRAVVSAYVRSDWPIEPHDIEDIVGQVTLYVLRKLRAATVLEEESVQNVEAYVTTLTKNIIRDVMRRRSPERTRIKSRLRARHDVVHLATHALIDESQPLYSGLVLATGGPLDDGLLEARELQSLDLDAELVVLSACSTARGRSYGGEGVVGLAWALLSRGVPQVVVSQWNADSKATTKLMIAFHRFLVAGHTPAAALRKAQLELRKDVRYEDPLYWAPFVVLGSSVTGG